MYTNPSSTTPGETTSTRTEWEALVAHDLAQTACR